MTVNDLVDFLNSVDLHSLDAGLDELENKVHDIFLKTESELDEVFVHETRSGNAEFLIWFCFLRSNFLRGKDIISNRAFKQFMDFCTTNRNGYYFDGFPTAGGFLPKFSNPKFRNARAIEEVLRQLREKYVSGQDFVREIRGIVESYGIDEVHKLYLALISKFMGLKQIARKIANAIVGEVSYQMRLLEEYGEREKYDALSKEMWIRKLMLASCFNVMIDTHVRNFFEKHGIKNVEHSVLLLLARDVKTEVVRFLFERSYPWLNEEDRTFILGNYHDYIGANVVEKLVWEAYFVKKNSPKNESIDDLQFYKLSKEIFRP
jgi:hypothetical protein